MPATLTCCARASTAAPDSKPRAGLAIGGTGPLGGGAAKIAVCRGFPRAGHVVESAGNRWTARHAR